MKTGLFGAVATAQGESGEVAIFTFIAGSARIAQSVRVRRKIPLHNVVDRVSSQCGDLRAVMNVERLPVLRRVACEFEERMLDLGVPFILRHPICDRTSVPSLQCPVSALSEASNQARSAAPGRLPKNTETASYLCTAGRK